MQADQLFTGGTVRTGVPGAPPSGALAVAGGRVLALGEDALASRGPRTEVTDLAGGALLPSFGDGHAHPLLGGLGLRGVPVRQARSVDGDPRRGRRLGRRAPRCGVGDRRRVRPHAGRRRAVRRPLAGHGRRRPAGGAAHDGPPHHVGQQRGAAPGRHRRRHPRAGRGPDRAPRRTARRWAPCASGAPSARSWTCSRRPARPSRPPPWPRSRRCSPPPGSPGSRTPGSSPDQVDAWLAAAAAGLLRFRANLAFRAEPTSWKDQLGEFAADRDRVSAQRPGLADRPDGEVLRRRRHRSRHRRPAAALRRLPALARDRQLDAGRARRRDRRGRRAGFQAHVHAIGDAGVRLALDAIAETARRNGPADRRPVLAHVQLIDPADLPRFAALGVIANLEPLWAQPDPLMTELTLPRVGAARGARQYQIASLLRSGARVSFGSDWPVTAYQPLPGIATAVTRQTPDGHPDGGWLPAERVTADQALAAYSAGVAYQAFEEHHWGVLRPGMRADLVHLAADPGRHPRPRAARPARAGHLARRNPHPLTIPPNPRLPSRLGADPVSQPPASRPRAPRTRRARHRVDRVLRRRRRRAADRHGRHRPARHHDRRHRRPGRLPDRRR